MAQKFQVDSADTAQTHAFAALSGSSHPRPAVELRQSLVSQIEAIEPFVEQLMRFVSRFRDPEDIDIAVHEALANAVIHGNGGNPGKRVYVSCRCDIDGEVLVTIRDEGLGFDVFSVPDPTAPENQMCPHGRGICLMKNTMDEVHFEEGGAVVRMRKKSHAGPQTAGARP